MRYLNGSVHDESFGRESFGREDFGRDDGSRSGYPFLPSDAFVPRTARRSRRSALVAAAGAIVSTALAIGVSAIHGGDDEPPAPIAAGAAPTASAAAVSAEFECPTHAEGNVTTGRDAGGQDSGPDVIKAFNDAYYTERRADAVTRFVQPAALDAVIPSIENLQQAIDALPETTTHCLTIIDVGSGLYKVDLAQIDPTPGGDRITFHQLIQTIDENGRWLIVSNTAID